MNKNPKQSAGLLMYRKSNGEPEFFLIHPGGPFWAKKDLGAWSIPKGEFNPDEDPFEAAKREFTEEIGIDIVKFIYDNEYIALTPLKQPSGKMITVWAFGADFNPDHIRSNAFEMEWPPHSGKQMEFPEADRAGWFNINDAKLKITKGQIGFLDELYKKIKGVR